MQNFALLLLCFALGVALRKAGRLPEATPAALNGFIVHVSLPALTLHHLRHLQIDASVAAPLAMAWLLFAAGVAFFFAAQRLFRWSSATTGALILTGALGNTSFVGVPMIECFFGREHVGLGILIDQLGTYVVLCTVGLLVAATLSAGELTARAVAQRIFTFPPFLAVLAALALAPLALLSVGFQLRFAAVRSRWRPLAAGLGYKLLAGPLVVLAAFAAFADLDSPAMQVAVFEAAMAPMIGGAIVATQHKLDPELTTLMVGVGIPLSFLTVPAWWFALAAL